MEMDQSLIDKFLKNRCSADEARHVHEYLMQHPEVLERLYRTDWEAAGEGPQVDHGLAEQMYQVISKRISKDRGGKMRYMGWAAAAAIVLMIWGGWQFRTDRKVVDAPVKAIVSREKVLPQKGVTDWQLVQNNTKGWRRIKLPDSSVVSLRPGAAIKYQNDFGTDKRDVVLEGEGLFDVVKDKTRPFTVYAGGLSTTALGTSFRVRQIGATVRVQLLTGKVVVKAVDSLLPGWKKDVYLLPGQQLGYDGAARLVKVSVMEGGRQVDKGQAGVADHEEGMVFEDTPLEQVFDKLGKRYKVSITYTPEALKGLHFSGRVLHNDSLSVLLQVIGRMNNLAVASEPDGFSIRKGTDQ
jgi:ferric-dicitrate binding protein FerR (iron transport regulator)